MTVTSTSVNLQVRTVKPLAAFAFDRVLPIIGFAIRKFLGNGADQLCTRDNPFPFLI